MDKYFKPESCREQGTLYQLKNLVNRRNVSKNVSSNYHAASEFIDLVTDCHVIAACLEYCGMGNLESQCKKNTNCITSSRFHGKKKSTTSFGWRNSGYFFSECNNNQC